MENIITTQARVNDAAIHNMFEIEELEQRLETVSDWEGSVETTSGPDGTTCTAKISCKF